MRLVSTTHTGRYLAFKSTHIHRNQSIESWLRPHRGCWQPVPSAFCCWLCLQPGPTFRTSRGPTPSCLAAQRSSAAETAWPFHGAEQHTDSLKSQLVRSPVSPAIDDLIAGDGCWITDACPCAESATHHHHHPPHPLSPWAPST